MQINSPFSYDFKKKLADGDQCLRFLFTGGPCAGKTTAMAEVLQDLT